jgi:hypothetical protein
MHELVLRSLACAYNLKEANLRVAGLVRSTSHEGLLGRHDNFSSLVAFDQPNEHWSEF